MEKVRTETVRIETVIIRRIIRVAMNEYELSGDRVRRSVTRQGTLAWFGATTLLIAR
jgi:trimethylamine:corrinoid methyltransferase-like protein